MNFDLNEHNSIDPGHNALDDQSSMIQSEVPASEPLPEPTHPEISHHGPHFGSWEQSSYSGAFYERRPDGSYTGNWSR